MEKQIAAEREKQKDSLTEELNEVKEDSNFEAEIQKEIDQFSRFDNRLSFRANLLYFIVIFLAIPSAFVNMYFWADTLYSLMQ